MDDLQLQDSKAGNYVKDIYAVSIVTFIYF